MIKWIYLAGLCAFLGNIALGNGFAMNAMEVNEVWVIEFKRMKGEF